MFNSPRMRPLAEPAEHGSRLGLMEEPAAGDMVTWEEAPDGLADAPMGGHVVSAEGAALRSHRVRVATVAAVVCAACAACFMAVSAPNEPKGRARSFGSLQNLEQGTTCTNWDESVISTSFAQTMDECRQMCASIDDCKGFLYRRAEDDGCSDGVKTCALTNDKCEVGHDVCWERVATDMQVGYTVTWGMGCSNWQSLQLGDMTIEATAQDCFNRCVGMPGCQGFGFQTGENDQCLEGQAHQPGSCSLWKGPCVHEINGCWSDYHMVAPTPTIFSLTGQRTFCRNWEQVLLAKVAEKQPHEEACATQCMLTNGCTGFAFQPDTSCQSSVDLDSSCVLFQGECIPEPNFCSWTYNMTEQPGRKPLSSMPMPISPAYQFPFKGVQCASVQDSLVDFPVALASKDDCNALCYGTQGCQGFSYHAPNKSCAMWGDVCLNSGYTETYQILWPTLIPIIDASPGTGCSNWRDIKLGPVLLGMNNFSCALACKRTYGCMAYNLQGTTCDEDREHSMEKGACLLYHGVCEQEPNSCWDYAAVPMDVNYAETTLPDTSTTTVTTNTAQHLHLRERFVAIQRVNSPALKGSTSISLMHESQYEVGDVIEMTDGVNVQDNVVASVNPLKLRDPLKYDFHPENTEVGKEPPKGPPTTSTSTTTPVTTVTFTKTKAAAGSCVAVFINEIRSKTSGSSTACGVEIAGKAGTDLSGWQIQIFNTAGQQEGSTATINGAISTSEVLWQSTPATSFAAVALLDNTGKLVQFLSMGSTVTAQNGAAAVQGQAAVDIGVSLTSTSADSDSLQLKGSGGCYKDFQWRVHTNSENAANGLQDFTFA
jgi:hypothetical protein